MNRRQLTEELNRIFLWKHNSLARYIIDARPYVPPGHERNLAIVAEIAERDERDADQIATLIESFETVATSAPHAKEVTEYNYLSLPYLVAKLLESLDEQREVLISARDRFGALEEVDDLLSRLLAQTENYLARLEQS